MVGNLVRNIFVGLFLYFSVQTIISQNTFRDRYYFNTLYSNEFYNVDFTTLNKYLGKLDSEEISGASFGLALGKKGNKSYTTLEFRLLKNRSKIINLKGYSFYVSTNYNILKKAKNHLLYPKLSIAIDKYSLKPKQDLNLGNNIILKDSEITSNYPVSIALGIGYEYLFNIRYKSKIMRFSIGLNFEKSTFINNPKWELENSSINYFKTDLISGIKTKTVVRFFLSE